MKLLLVCGSLRDASTNLALLRTVAQVAPPGVEAEVYKGLRDLPHFDPDEDHDPLPPAVADLRARIAAADALLFSTPEYAGALPGSFKNLLDWTVGGVEICDKPVAWINTSQRGAAKASASLRTVLGYVGADIVEDACRHIAVAAQDVGPDGTIRAPERRHDLAAALADLASRAGADGAPAAGAPADHPVRVAAFADLDAASLYALLRLRSEVFVVEQQCPYAELDGRDTESATLHLWLERAGAPVAYLRILDDGSDGLRIGRVVTAPDARGGGLAAILMRRAVALTGERAVTLGAQVRLEPWYERFGFRRTGADYLEDGMAHVPMRREMTPNVRKSDPG